MSKLPFGLCMNTSTLRGCGAAMEQIVAATAEAGFHGIEPWVRELDAWCESGKSLADFRALCTDAGLQIVNLIGFFEWAADDEDRRRAGFEEARRNFAQARELGCPYVAAPPFGMTTAVGADLLAFAQRYAALVDLGAEFDVVPLLEYWGHSQALGRLGEALLVLAECDRPQARLLADTFHTYKGSGSLSGLRLLGPRSLGLLHINDYPAAPPREEIKDAARVYPGDGVAPLREVLGDLAAAGWEGMLSLELFNEAYWQQDPATVARTGMEKLQAVLARVE